MAGEVQELLIKYTSDISQLQSSAAQLEQEFRKVTSAAEGSSKAVETTLNKQAALISSVTNRLVQLAAARDKASGEGEASRLVRINNLIEQQEERLNALRNIPPIQILSTEQVGIIDQARASLEELRAARDSSQDTSKIELFNTLIAQQEEAIRRLTEIPKLEVVTEQQLGLLERSREELENLRAAREKAQDPTQVQLLTKLIGDQEQAIAKLTELPPIQIVTQEQIGLITAARNELEELTKARDAADNPEKIQLLNQLIAQQQAGLEKLTTIPPPKLVDPAQLGLIENARSRLKALTDARDKSNDPQKLIRINNLITEQDRRLRQLQGIKSPPALDPAHNNVLANSFESLGNKILIAFSIEAVVRFGNEAVEAFARAQKGALQLLGALNNNEEQQKRLIQFSTELQDRFAISKDTLNSQAAFLAIQGLTEEQIKKTLEAAIQLSEAIPGKDLQTAVTDLAATFEGNVGRLGRFNKEIDNLTKTELENGRAVEIVLKQYQGFAEKGLAGVAGQARRAEIELEDTKQRLGETLVPYKQFFDEFKNVWLKGFEGILDTIRDFNNAVPQLLSGTFKGFGVTPQSEVEKNKQEFEKQKNFNLKALQNANKELLEQQIADDKERLKQQQGSAKVFTEARIAAAEELLRKLQKLEEEAAQKRIETEARVQQKIADLQSDLSKVENPRTTGKARADDLRRQIEEQQRILDEIQGKSQAEALKKREEASKQLAELEKKIGKELLTEKAQTDLERLALDKKFAEDEVKILFEASKKTLEDKQNLNSALLKLEEEFGIKERAIILKNAQEAAKLRVQNAQDAVDQIKDEFDTLNDDLDTRELIATTKVKQEFITTGDFSPEAFEKRDAEITAIEERFNNLRIDNQKKFVDKFIAQNDRLFKSKKDLAELDKANIQRELFANSDQLGLFGLPSPTQFADAAAKIQKIDDGLNKERQQGSKENAKVLNEAEQSIQKAKAKSADSQAESNKKIQESDAKLLEARKQLRLQIASEVGQGVTDLVVKTAQVRAEAQIKAIEDVRDAQLDSIDQQIEANKKAGQNEAISAKESRQRNEELLRKKKEAEERAAREIARIKRQQFIADQVAAVSRIIIENTINAAATPALAELYAILAAAQVALVLAQPNPYRHGSKDTKGGLALVGEEGEELVMMPQGAKVLPNKQTKQNADVIDAMFDNRLEEHVRKVFVEPALKEQAAKIAISREFFIQNPVLAKMLMEITDTRVTHTTKDTSQTEKLNELVQKLVDRVVVERTVNKHLYDRFTTEQIVERLARSVQRYTVNSITDATRVISETMRLDNSTNVVRETMLEKLTSILGRTVSTQIGEVVNDVISKEHTSNKQMLMDTILTEVNRNVFTQHSMNKELVAQTIERLIQERVHTDKISEVKQNLYQSLVRIVDKNMATNISNVVSEAITKEQNFSREQLMSEVLSEVNKQVFSKYVIRENYFKELIAQSLQRSVYSDVDNEKVLRTRIRNTVEMISEDAELTKNIIAREQDFTLANSIMKMFSNVSEQRFDNKSERLTNNDVREKITNTSSSIESSNQLKSLLEPRITFAEPIRINKEVFKKIISEQVQIQEVHVASMLRAATNTYQAEREKIFADNIANSFIMNNANGISMQEADEIRRRGTYIRNLEKEITEPLLEKLDGLFKKPSYKR